MSIADKIGRLTAARNSIRAALIDKGVAAGSHGFEAFAADIASISGGTVGTVSQTMPDWSVSISFPVQGQPKMFAVIATVNLSTDGQICAAVWDGSAADVQVRGSLGHKEVLTQTYSNGTLQISTTALTNGYWANGVEYKLVYVY